MKFSQPSTGNGFLTSLICKIKRLKKGRITSDIMNRTSVWLDNLKGSYGVNISVEKQKGDGLNDRRQVSIKDDK